MSRQPTQRVEPGSVAHPHTRQLESTDPSRIEATIARGATSKDHAGLQGSPWRQERHPDREVTDTMEASCFPLFLSRPPREDGDRSDNRLTPSTAAMRQRSVTRMPSYGSRLHRGRP